MTSPKPTLIYVGDPMCSWCYGIAPELEQLRDHYGDQLDYELVLGGLRPYNTESMTDLKAFLTDHWQDVHNASKQPFRYEVLDKGDWLYDTEPACRAAVVFRSEYPDQSFDFFAAVQKAFYYENQNPSNVNTYLKILEDNGWQFPNFKEKFESSEFKEAVKDDFRKAQSLNVSAFPTLLLLKDGKTHVLNRGYRRADSIKRQIDDLLE